MIAESLRLSPSSYGLQPWKFFIVENPQLRKELKAVSWNQTQIEDADKLVVFTTLKTLDEKYIEKWVHKMAETRGVPLESLKGYKDLMVSNLVSGPRSETIHWWAQRQSYIAMGQMMYTAALLGVDTCPMEGLDPAAYDTILKLENTGYQTVAVVTVGYRHKEDSYQNAKKARFDSEDIFATL